MKTLLLAILALQQADHGVDQNRVDKAIDRGTEWLLKQKWEAWKYHDWGNMRHHDLVLYTLHHAGVDPQNEVYQQLLKFILEAPLERTYCVSLQAMYLAAVDPLKYQPRLRQCAQFLVDNQCRNGQWSYGVEVPQEKETPTTSIRPDVATGPGSAKPAAKKKAPPVTIKRRQKTTVESGDNSNSQYAALGLRACLEANVVPPAETLKDACAWWEKSQNNDGGWSYGDKGAGASYGSMTAGAVSSLIILKHYLKENWRADRRVADGIAWLVKNWDVRKNPGTNEGFVWVYYYLYAVERTGILSEMEKFGRIEWYKTGAEHILSQQLDDGSWSEGNTYGGAAKDVCFAILFLRRATVPFPKVASVDKKR